MQYGRVLAQIGEAFDKTARLLGITSVPGGADQCLKLQPTERAVVDCSVLQKRLGTLRLES